MTDCSNNARCLNSLSSAQAALPSERSHRQATALAERMRPVMTELADLSAQKAAAELNRRKIASATGGKWYAATVIRLRERLRL